MRAPVPVWVSDLNFDALGRTLRHFAGNHVRVEVLVLVDGRDAEHVQAMPLAVIEGQLRLVTADEMPENQAPPETTAPGELAHLLDIDGTLLPISGIDLEGAMFDASARVANWQLGPAVFRMTINSTEG